MLYLGIYNFFIPLSLDSFCSVKENHVLNRVPQWFTKQTFQNNCAAEGESLATNRIRTHLMKVSRPMVPKVRKFTSNCWEWLV